MNNKPGGAIIKIIMIVLVAALAYGGYMYYQSQNEVVESPTTPEEVTEVEEVDESPDSEDMSAVVDTSTWATVSEPEYEFMHPDYFIQDNTDHYIMAVEPVQGQEFQALVIYKPTDITDPKAVLEQKMVDAESLGVEVTSEPKEIQLEGFQSAYWVAYDIESGPTSGANKTYLLQSPYTDKWVMIEYAENDNAEQIMRSFKFVEE